MGKQSDPISPKISANNFAGILRTCSQNLVVSLVFAHVRKSDVSIPQNLALARRRDATATVERSEKIKDGVKNTLPRNPKWRNIPAPTRARP